MKLKCSEAIMLGSTIVTRWVGGKQNDGDGGGCALGMMNRALGTTFGDTYKVYPWLLEGAISLPCSCQEPLLIGGGNRLLSRSNLLEHQAHVLVHLFNYHVMMAKDWTLEQLADWVRTVEPVESEAAPMPEKQTVSV